MAFKVLQNTCNKHLMVTANEDITVDGNIKDNRKLLAAWAVSNFVSRLDKPDVGATLKDIDKDQMPINIGLFMNNSRVTSKSCSLPIAKFNNVYTSGTTGAGKTCACRVVIEEATQYKNLSILIISPRNQAAGLFVAEDRESFLSSYPEFGMDRNSAHGYKFNYYAPDQNFGQKLPDDLSQLAQGRSVVVLKWVEEKQRYEYFKEILDSVFKFCSKEEAHITRLLIVVEEAHCFTKKRADDSAKAAAEKAELALDRMVREGRKYGCCVIIDSQSIKDFARDSASIRQNTNTKIFLHNTDREIRYAADFIGDGRQIVRLPPATAIIFNPAWGVIKVKIRPPYSKVWDFSAEDTAKIIQKPALARSLLAGSPQRLLELIKEHYDNTGQGMNLSEAAMKFGVSSKRKIQGLVGELEHAGYIKTYRINQRGKPRIIEPVNDRGVD